MLATLENDAERAKFVGQLRALVAARAPIAQASSDSNPVEVLGTLALTTLAARVNQLSTDVLSALAAVDVLTAAPRIFNWIQDLIVDADQNARAREVLLKLGIVLGSALAAEAIIWLLLGRVRRLIEAKRAGRIPGRLGLLLARAGADLLPIIVFGITANLALPMTGTDVLLSWVAGTLIYALILARAVNLLGRMVLAPYSPGLRLLPIGDETAVYLYLWTRRFAGLWIYGYFILEPALLLGLPYAVYIVLLRFLGLTLATLAVIFILQNRIAVAEWLRRPSPQKEPPDTAAGGAPIPHANGDGLGSMLVRLKQRSAEVWHALAVFYVVAIYAVLALDIPGGRRHHLPRHRLRAARGLGRA